MLQLKSAHVFALITGASRGFGRSIAKQFLAQVLPLHPASVTLNLHASPASHARLDELKAALQKRSADLLSDSSCLLRINTMTLDLRTATQQAALPLMQLTEHHGQDGAAQVDSAFLFSNAGVLQPGRIDSGLPAGPDGLLASSLAVNTVAVATLMSAFLHTFKPPTRRFLQYTSTLCSLSPFASWAAYSVSKAATEMLHRVAAEENPDARVLLYAPGPMDTDMVNGALSDKQLDHGLRTGMERSKGENSLVNVDETAMKMVRLLVQDEYKNGQHIDFFDP